MSNENSQVDQNLEQTASVTSKENAELVDVDAVATTDASEATTAVAGDSDQSRAKVAALEPVSGIGTSLVAVIGLGLVVAFGVQVGLDHKETGSLPVADVRIQPPSQRHAMESVVAWHAPRHSAVQSRVAVKKTRPLISSDTIAEARRIAQEKTLLAEINQLDATTLKQRAYDYLRGGESNRAVSCLIRAVRLNPNDGLTRQYLAYSLLGIDETESAVEQYKAFEQLSRPDANERLAFGVALTHAPNKVAARTYFDQLIKDSAYDAALLLVIAQKCEDAGLLTQATNAASLGMNSEVPAERAQFQRYVEKLNAKKSAPEVYTNLPKLS